MKRGLLISGGGTKISGHAGFCSAFELMRIKFDSVSGVSAGAILAPFAAAGRVRKMGTLFHEITPEQFWKRNPMGKNGGLSKWAIWNILTGKTALGDFSNLEKTIREHFSVADWRMLDQNSKKVFCQAVDMSSGAIRVDDYRGLSYSSFISAIVDSASIPPFADVSSGADGGIREFLPVSSLDQMGKMDELFCLYARPEDLSGVLGPYNPKSAIDPIERALQIALYQISKNDREKAQRWCLENGVIYREFFQPKIMKGTYDTDKSRQFTLFNACESIALNQLGYK